MSKLNEFVKPFQSNVPFYLWFPECSERIQWKHWLEIWQLKFSSIKVVCKLRKVILLTKKKSQK